MKRKQTEPPSEIIITPDHYNYRWLATIPDIDHGFVVTDERGSPFFDIVDPMVVAKALKTQAQGPINVVVNL